MMLVVSVSRSNVFSMVIMDVLCMSSSATGKALGLRFVFDFALGVQTKPFLGDLFASNFVNDEVSVAPKVCLSHFALYIVI